MFEALEPFGLDPKKEMPFFGLLKSEIFGKKPVSELSDSEIDFLVNTTKDIIEIISRETQYVEFCWENAAKQRRLKSHIVLQLLKKISPSEATVPLVNSITDIVFSKRNEIAQKLIELAYHHFRK